MLYAFSFVAYFNMDSIARDGEDKKHLEEYCSDLFECFSVNFDTQGEFIGSLAGQKAEEVYYSVRKKNRGL